ncbi:family 20 glycosylhydrolase [uncultured Winogradskyella sp.]|uniref:beta-N-acetylhexosaminidase n=1 Tax=uncultured Winogradskyella sp. TaxID=395353 RepID=UPI00261BE5E2|nr:family 20 glycosylhydrolase [uncultured Winogradskyella sp.]
MHFKTSFGFIILLLTVLSCQQKNIETQEIAIIPQPNSIEVSKTFFVLNHTTGINYDNIFEISADFLKSYLESGGIEVKSGNNITFIEDKNLQKEAYSLNVIEDSIEIKASTDQGAFYAVQTLRQLLPVEFENASFKGNQVNIPSVVIEDSPQFAYRGMHLDVSRHVFSLEFIKKYIDAIAMLKMNTFHWHLTDDQGWRIEIKKYPKLQEIAAYRDETLVGHYSDQPHQFDGKKYGGFYSQEEIKDIVAYAQEHFVTIIPEIEMPGHSQAAIAAYPELGCTGEKVEVAKKWGVFEDIYCTNDETFDFLEDVLDEVLELFPSKYIHIGGDEAPKTRWKSCANCQTRIKEEGLKDEHELQNYFITRIEKYLNSKGRQIIGWDEILEGGLAPNATVMSWRGTSGAVEAAKSGHNVVMTPTSHCYFDYYQSDNEDEPLAIGGFLHLEKVYGFNPIPEELTSEEAQYVLGAQGNIWTEYMPAEDQVEYMAFPRMLAMSEVLWSDSEQKSYGDFVKRLESFHKRLDALDINYANHLYEIESNIIEEDGEIKLELNSLVKEGKVIRVTLNGDKPNYESRVYTKPIVIDTSRTIKAAVFKFNSNEKLGKTIIQNINYHKGVGGKIIINKQPHKAYSGSGSKGLINGISGSNSRFGDKEWLGFWGEDIMVEIDLGEEKEIKSIETRFYNGNGQWIYAPKEILVAFDNEQYQSFKLDDDGSLISFKSHFLDQSAKKIYIKVQNYGTIPEGKQGAGHKAWTFIDEIIIN